MTNVTLFLWDRCRDVAAALIAGLSRREIAEVSARIDAAPALQQRGIVFGTLGGLMGASLLAAQFGLLGLCIFWLTVIWLVR
ncbi:MAG: hypothetical protein AAGM84_08655 [Pseudomonadota bacterium]